MRTSLFLWSLCLSCAMAGTVRKTLETFDAAAWPASSSSSAPGTTSLSGDTSPDLRSQRSMKFTVQFSGEGFQFSGIDTPAAVVIPGDAKSITLRGKKSDKRYSLLITFTDGWGRTQIGKQKLEWGVPTDDGGEWGTGSFTFPDYWVRPITVRGFTVHNWFAKSDQGTVDFWVDDIQVVTDVSAVDPASGAMKGWTPNPAETDPKKNQPPVTPLLSFDVGTGVEANLFSREEPAARVTVRNWRPGTVAGQLAWTVLDHGGAKVLSRSQAVSVESVAALPLPLPVERFGRYALETTLALPNEKERVQRLVFARVPPYADLTEAQKLSSPYGMNVHGGSTRLLIEPFRKAGILWFRDYAFSFEWLLRAKGGDRRYAGWPWYPKLVRRYADAGVKLLACSMKAMSPPKVKDGKAVGPVGPDLAWVREIADFTLAFPQVTHWELDNEYDLHAGNAEAEEAVGWRNYQAYHRKFGEVVHLLGGGTVVPVEQGRAGIWPRRVEACVRSGAFDLIPVVNSHHYCGVDTPELNFANFNTGFSATPGGGKFFFDSLRAVKRAAQADGKPRESWLTEIGWDSLAGKVVSPYEQAVYLPRMWMLCMAAGTDKVFWFFDYDAPEPKQFFDGCGLVDAAGQPKLVLCAAAGLTSVLPTPRYVGSLDAGPNTAGHVFENDGKLVASLWTIEGDDGPEVDFGAGRLFDYLGNPLPGTSARLTMAPVYAVGIGRESAWYRQTAYSLDTPHLEIKTSGDRVVPVLRVTNRRDAAIQCRVSLTLPEGWSAETAELTATVPQGGTKDLKLPFRIAPDEPLGRRQATLAIAEGNQALKTMPLHVLVRPPLMMQVGPMKGQPGEATVTVKVGNTSSAPLDGVLRLRLPVSWKALPPELPVKTLQPDEVRSIDCRLAWTADWKEGESASVEFDAGQGRRVVRSIIPNHARIHRAPKLTIDGQFGDWPENSRVPDWMLGSSLDAARATVRLAWAPEGLYAAVEVRDSKVQASDPRSFWAGDCLELFVDTADDKRDRSFEPGDHQFWFVPLVQEGRIYAGRWKRKDEIPATRYDIREVRGAARRTDDGYAMEFLLPAAALEKYKPQAGARLGLNLNLTVKGSRLDREVYWPARKEWGVMNLPKTWGSVTLVE